MAVAANVLKTKVTLRYEKGSSTYSSIREDAPVEDIFEVAVAINGLQTTPAERILKGVETELMYL